ncbi:hypothetical protein NE237_023416 [Protea cynaroides]|uniref:Uncharacterized protein n=1 Tax=Protea cynaroides TaxID=273540 RepID=A0A9Q0HG83_9MAGN|nr:hypothetical protein NE237_023416 [Protea cynaroides]
MSILTNQRFQVFFKMFQQAGSLIHIADPIPDFLTLDFLQGTQRQTEADCSLILHFRLKHSFHFECFPSLFLFFVSVCTKSKSVSICEYYQSVCICMSDNV